MGKRVDLRELRQELGAVRIEGGRLYFHDGYWLTTHDGVSYIIGGMGYSRTTQGATKPSEAVTALDQLRAETNDERLRMIEAQKSAAQELGGTWEVVSGYSGVRIVLPSGWSIDNHGFEGRIGWFAVSPGGSRYGELGGTNPFRSIQDTARWISFQRNG